MTGETDDGALSTRDAMSLPDAERVRAAISLSIGLIFSADAMVVGRLGRRLLRPGEGDLLRAEPVGVISIPRTGDAAGAGEVGCKKHQIEGRTRGGGTVKIIMGATEGNRAPLGGDRYWRCKDWQGGGGGRAAGGRRGEGGLSSCTGL